MPLVQTRGAASAQGFGEFAQVTAANYIEDMFSCFLYTGNGSTQTITNNIDLSTKGGLVWIKSRSGTFAHRLTDTARGATKELVSNAVTIEATVANGLTAFNSTGFALGSDINFNNNTSTYTSWTFRKQPKFFDVVTYTGNSVSGRAIPHNLGSAPGCVIIKAIDQPENWAVWHRGGSQDNTHGAYLNTSAAYSNKAIALWGSSPGTPDMNATTFSVGGTTINNGGGSPYVAYLFAHDAGGFGLTGTDNVISCGSYTGVTYPNSLEVNVGFEPQWVMIKNATTASGWAMWDTMRGMSVVPAANTAQALLLEPNTSAAESNQPGIFPTATGFVVKNGLTSISGTGDNIIYIAIRRGPMKVPTLGTSVYNAIARTGTGAAATITGVGFPPDLVHSQERGGNAFSTMFDKLRGTGRHLYTQTTTAETTRTTSLTSFNMDGITVGADGDNNVINFTSLTYINHFLKRSPSFMDIVCYTGTGSATTFSHNLQAVPELMIVKKRSAADDWAVYAGDNTDFLLLNATAATADDNTYWNDTSPTSTVFSVGTNADVNTSSATYVAYLFATCAGVSKVGSYTGTATTLQIDCGFTAGARFVLIKRTDSTGDWYFWDTTRGIVAGNDPYLLLNNLAAEVTNTDYVDTYNAGFEISSTAPAPINASYGTYIFLAIA